MQYRDGLRHIQRLLLFDTSYGGDRLSIILFKLIFCFEGLLIGPKYDWKTVSAVDSQELQTLSGLFNLWNGGVGKYLKKSNISQLINLLGGPWQKVSQLIKFLACPEHKVSQLIKKRGPKQKVSQLIKLLGWQWQKVYQLINFFDWYQANSFSIDKTLDFSNSPKKPAATCHYWNSRSVHPFVFRFFQNQVAFYQRFYH